VAFGVRPEWLINPETGNALEIDIYFPDLKLGFEIQGTQHYRFTPGLQATYADYQKQLRHDTLKIQVCLDKGVALHCFSIFELQESRFVPFIRGLYQSWGRLPEFERISSPIALFRQAERLSRARVVPKKPYRKPGFWPLLKRIFA
jgi:hypothetical protein